MSDEGLDHREYPWTHALQCSHSSYKHIDLLHLPRSSLEHTGMSPEKSLPPENSQLLTLNKDNQWKKRKIQQLLGFQSVNTVQIDLCMCTWRRILSKPFRVMRDFWVGLMPSIARNPSAFDMSLALKPFAPTTSPAPYEPTFFLGFVATVLTPCAALPQHHPPP